MLRRLSVSAVVLVSCMLSLLVLFPVTAHAAECNPAKSNFFAMPTWHKYLEHSTDTYGCTVELPTETVDGVKKVDVQASVLRIAVAVFEIIIRFAGIIALIFVVYGGFQYVISQGEPDRLKAARTTLINALVGLVIALSATVIVRLVGGIFG